MRPAIIAAIGIGAVLAGSAAWIGFSAHATRAEINGFEATLAERASAAETVWTDGLDPALPEPVRRYFAFAMPDGPPDFDMVEIEARGRFRRPLTEGFAPTTARQAISLRAPDLVFSANTPIIGPLWAVAYDRHIDGEMEMAAKLLSTFTVMFETSTPALNRTSLRRWLLESPAYPMALLPGGPVTWEPVDENRARAVISAHGETASLVATFDASGALTRFDAEEGGDLTTPYHGSGEHTARGDYGFVQGIRVPMSFMIARAAGDDILPFWIGEITSITFR